MSRFFEQSPSAFGSFLYNRTISERHNYNFLTIILVHFQVLLFQFLPHYIQLHGSLGQKTAASSLQGCRAPEESCQRAHSVPMRKESQRI
jgi:hypothetical protein